MNISIVEARMFFGVTLVGMANLISLSNYLSDVLPPRESDPIGIFDKPLLEYYDYIVGTINIIILYGLLLLCKWVNTTPSFR